MGRMGAVRGMRVSCWPRMAAFDLDQVDPVFMVYVSEEALQVVKTEECRDVLKSKFC